MAPFILLQEKKWVDNFSVPRPPTYFLCNGTQSENGRRIKSTFYQVKNFKHRELRFVLGLTFLGISRW
jgi:hypothetical protein